MSRKTFLWVGVAVALILAGVISFYASSSPDGLEKVAEDKGFIDSADDSQTADLPLADYGTSGVDNARLSVGIAGVVGVAVTFAVAGGIFWLIARKRDSGEPQTVAASGQGEPPADRP